MNLSDLILVFLAVFICGVGVFNYNVDVASEANQMQIEYSQKLTTACEDAVSSANTENIIYGQDIWAAKESRLVTIGAFFNSLEASFNTINQGNDVVGEVDIEKWKQKHFGDTKVKLYTPVIVLVDMDGYYVCHNVISSTYPIDPAQITSINTWAASYGGYTVRYHLDDYVEVITPDGSIYKGDRNIVAGKIAKAVGTLPNELGFLADNETQKNTGETVFEYNRNKLIVNEIKDTVTYYINQENYYKDGRTINGNTGLGYQITMAEVSGSDWSRLLENPTVISFLQGDSLRMTTDKLNVYALAGSEISRSDRFFITPSLSEDGNSVVTDASGNAINYYHSFRESLRQGTLSSNNGKYYYTDHAHHSKEITKFFVSMEDCAKTGAYPCPKCIQNN